MIGALLAVVVVLTVATAFSFVHSSSSKLSVQELRASNARVLREYKRIALHEPEKIVDYQPERSWRARDAHHS